jgi:hypothetical protein
MVTFRAAIPMLRDKHLALGSARIFGGIEAESCYHSGSRQGVDRSL